MNTGRPLTYKPSDALEAATAAFWSHGYDGSSLQDLLSATGLSKSSLYQQFGSKPQLFQRSLAHYAENMETLLSSLLASAPSGFLFFSQLLDQIIHEAQPARGCLLFNTASEFGQYDDNVGEEMRRGFERIHRIFVSALDQDRQAGILAQTADCDALASFIVTSIGGLRAMVKSGASPESLRPVVAIILQSLQHLSPTSTSP